MNVGDGRGAVGGGSRSVDQGNDDKGGPFDRRFTFILGLIFSLMEGIDLTNTSTSSSASAGSGRRGTSSSGSNGSVQGQGLEQGLGQGQGQGQGEDSAFTWASRGLYNPIQLIEKGGLEGFRSFLARCR